MSLWPSWVHIFAIAKESQQQESPDRGVEPTGEGGELAPRGKIGAVVQKSEFAVECDQTVVRSDGGFVM